MAKDVKSGGKKKGARRRQTPWIRACVVCGKTFEIRERRVRMTCSKECRRKQASVGHTRRPPDTPPPSPQDYSLMSPSGVVFIGRNYARFVAEHQELFAGISASAENAKAEAADVALMKLAPWVRHRRPSWNGWTWYGAPASPQPLRRAILSLGSNIEPRLAWIEKAVKALSAQPDFCDLRRSPIYETVPEDVPEAFRAQPFLNGIVTLKTRLVPDALLKATQAIENSLGRTRDGTRNAPRTIDIDIIALGDIVVIAPDLILPHPRAATRRFVLQPLADILPNYRLPGQTATVSELLQQLK